MPLHAPPILESWPSVTLIVTSPLLICVAHHSCWRPPTGGAAARLSSASWWPGHPGAQPGSQPSHSRRTGDSAGRVGGGEGRGENWGQCGDGGDPRSRCTPSMRPLTTTCRGVWGVCPHPPQVMTSNQQSHIKAAVVARVVGAGAQGGRRAGAQGGQEGRGTGGGARGRRAGAQGGGGQRGRGAVRGHYDVVRGSIVQGETPGSAALSGEVWWCVWRLCRSDRPF